jgi:hypothetical protein
LLNSQLLNSQLLNSHYQELTFDHPVVIRKKNAFEDAEEPDPEPKERTMTV